MDLTAPREPSQNGVPGQEAARVGPGRDSRRAIRQRAAAPGRVRREISALLELFALCGLAIAQPLLDITGRAPDFFLFHEARPIEILGLAGLVTLAPPLLCWSAGLLVGLAGRLARRTAHVLTVGALCVALAVQVGKGMLPVRGTPLAVLAVLAGVVLVAAYLRWAAAAMLLRVAAVGPLVFVALFVFASSTSPLLLGGKAHRAVAGRPVGPHPPLVVIFFDELPQLSLLDDGGRLDAGRFPAFAKLAGDSTWYRNATTAIGSTTYAIPSMLSGRYPAREAAPHYSQYPNNLFTLLAGSYDLRVNESVIQLCPPRDCARTGTAATGLSGLLGESATLLEQVVSPRDPPQAATGGFAEPTVGRVADQRVPAPTDVKFRWNRRADNQPLRFRGFLDGLRPSSRPTLHFLHLILPHHAFRYLPSGTQYAPWNQLRPDGAEMRGFWHERHLLQARYTDHLLGMAMDALRASGLYDKATVVVTADHGISFNPATELRLIDRAQRNAAEVAWVPLFIKGPGQRAPRVDYRNWQHVDLLPTLADYAGVSVPWPVDGISALGPTRPDSAKPFYTKAGSRFPLDSAGALKTVLAGPDALPYRLPRLFTHLVGRTVGSLPVRADGPAATLGNPADFRAVDPASGALPAIAHGTVPRSVPAGRQVAIALNGRIGAVARVMPVGALEKTRFAGLIADERLFRPGANQVELFLIDRSGTGLQRMSGGGHAG